MSQAGGSMVRSGNNAQMVDTNGDRRYDRVQFNVLTQETAILIDPDDPNAAVDSALAFFASVKKRPFQSFRVISGWVCLSLFLAGCAVAIIRRGEPEPNATGIAAFAPQVWGTRLGYWAKRPVQNMIGEAGDFMIQADGGDDKPKKLVETDTVAAKFSQ